MKKILIFTGAGIGVPLGLPTATGFSEDINDSSQEVIAMLIDYLGELSSDIERVLSTLESFESKEATFFEFMAPQIIAKVGARNHVIPFDNRVVNLKEQASNEIRRLKKIIFAKLKRFDPDRAADLYFNIIKELGHEYGESAYTIFTTNYDISFETGFAQNDGRWKKIGISGAEYQFKLRQPDLVFEATDKLIWRKDTLEYLKLHGSISWSRDFNDRCVSSSASVVPDNPDDMAILYPGFKKVPEKEPYKSMHVNLENGLREADHIIVIGFAFRDPYINNIFEDAMKAKPNTSIFYYDPNSLEGFPSDSKAPDFIGRYKNFKYIQREIEVIDNPLALRAMLSSGSSPLLPLLDSFLVNGVFGDLGKGNLYSLSGAFRGQIVKVDNPKKTLVIRNKGKDSFMSYTSPKIKKLRLQIVK